MSKNNQPTCHLDFLVFEETAELLAVLFPHVRRSLEVAQIEAPDIIAMLEAEVGSTKAPHVDAFLLRTLRRMPLSALWDENDEKWSQRNWHMMTRRSEGDHMCGACGFKAGHFRKTGKSVNIVNLQGRFHMHRI